MNVVRQFSDREATHPMRAGKSVGERMEPSVAIQAIPALIQIKPKAFAPLEILDCSAKPKRNAPGMARREVWRATGRAGSARAEHHGHVIALRHAGATLHHALAILEQNARRALEAKLDHQHLVRIQLVGDLRRQ